MEEQRESIKTRPLFDKACNEINNVLDSGHIGDSKYMDVVMQAYVGHIKIVNAERSKDNLRFVVSQSITDNVNAMKKALAKQLPEYIG